jgi:ribosomal protein S17
METTKKIKTLTGTVSSKSGIKSLRVTIDYRVKHPSTASTFGAGPGWRFTMS